MSLTTALPTASPTTTLPTAMTQMRTSSILSTKCHRCSIVIIVMKCVVTVILISLLSNYALLHIFALSVKKRIENMNNKPCLPTAIKPFVERFAILFFMFHLFTRLSAERTYWRCQPSAFCVTICDTDMRVRMPPMEYKQKTKGIT